MLCRCHASNRILGGIRSETGFGSSGSTLYSDSKSSGLKGRLAILFALLLSKNSSPLICCVELFSYGRRYADVALALSSEHHRYCLLSSFRWHLCLLYKPYACGCGIG